MMLKTLLLISLLGTFVSNNATPITKQAINTKQRHLKFLKSRTLYYSNHTATFNIVRNDLQLSGDIETNPGPVAKCNTCRKTVRCNQKRLLCEKCLESTHVNCTQLKSSNFPSRTASSWTCPQCLHLELPFSKVQDLNFSPEKLETEPDTVNTFLEILNAHRNRTSIGHLNTQSLLSTFAEFEVMMDTYKFDLMGVTESWLKDDPNLVNYVQLSGYELEYNNRNTGQRGGGVACYIKEGLKYKMRQDIINIDKSVEHLWIEVKGSNKNTSYLMGVLYQPSSDNTIKLEWLEKFETILSQITVKWDGIIILAGDFNIDLKQQDKAVVQRYFDILDTFSLTQHITKPTRKGKLIDHIVSNLPGPPITEDVIPADEISDHDMPFVTLNIKKPKFEPRYKIIRDEKNLNLNEYVTDFSTLPLNAVYAVEDPDDQVGILNDLILQCIDRHAPLKRAKLTRPPAPWMKDPEIIRLQANQQFLRKKAFESQSDSDMGNYRNTRNLLKRTIRNLKRKFYKTALSSNKSKLVWKTIHRILNPHHKVISASPNDLNDYYADLAENLTGSKSAHATKTNEPDDEASHHFIKLTNYNVVHKELTRLRNDCSTGFDSIPAKFIKPVADHLASPLTHIINNCIKKRIFPKQWKIAKICPVPKIQSPTKSSGYVRQGYVTQVM